MNLTYLVLGMGRSGQATCRFLIEKGHNVIAFDDQIESTVNNVRVLNNAEDVVWENIDFVVQSPGISMNFPTPHPVSYMAQKLNIPIMCDLDIFQQYKNPAIPCIGVTGTNGKSTTTALIRHILDLYAQSIQQNSCALMGGNIGTPALELLESGEVAYYVLELSSFQLELIHKLDLDVAVFLNLTPDHLDRHVDMLNYRRIKEKIFNHAKIKIKENSARNIITNENMQRFTHLQGEHNLQNINAAIEAVQSLGIDLDFILRVLPSFKGLPHRMEVVYHSPSLLIINDSKATNADSTATALQCYPDDDIYWIVGGKPKDGGIKSLHKFFPTLKRVYLIGASTDEFHDYLEECHVDDNIIYRCYYLQDAVSLALQHLANKSLSSNFGRRSILLFSPACASYDQFKNFEHRGEVFKDIALKSM